MTEQQMEEFEKEQLHVIVKQLEPCFLQYEVEVPSSFIEESHEKAIKRVGKQVSISGFRRGKAPRDLVVNQYGASIEKEWKENALRKVLSTSLEGSKFNLLDRDSVRAINWERWSKEEGAKLVYQCHVYPQVPLIDVSDIVITRQEPKSIEENDVQEVIDKARCSWKKEDRAIEHGDFITITYEELKGEQEPFSPLDRHAVDPNVIPEAFYRAVLGKESGDRIEVNDAEKELDFVCVIREVWTKTVLEMDEQFLKEMEIQSVDEWKKQIREELVEEENSRIQGEYQEALLDRLSSKYSFDVPLSLVKRMEEIMKKDRNQGSSEEGVEKEEPEKVVQLRFLFDFYAKEKKISISKKEMEQVLSWLLLFKQLVNREKSEKPTITRKDVIDVESRLLQQKILKQLLQQVQYQETACKT